MPQYQPSSNTTLTLVNIAFCGGVPYRPLMQSNARGAPKPLFNSNRMMRGKPDTEFSHRCRLAAMYSAPMPRRADSPMVRSGIGILLAHLI
jgi:hypothetical protein